LSGSDKRTTEIRKHFNVFVEKHGIHSKSAEELWQYVKPRIREAPDVGIFGWFLQMVREMVEEKIEKDMPEQVITAISFDLERAMIVFRITLPRQLLKRLQPQLDELALGINKDILQRIALLLRGQGVSKEQNREDPERIKRFREIIESLDLEAEDD